MNKSTKARRLRRQANQLRLLAEQWVIPAVKESLLMRAIQIEVERKRLLK